MVEVCSSVFAIEWVVSWIDSMLLLLLFLKDFSDPFPELVLYFSLESPSMLTLGVGSLIGSINNWSNGTFDNLSSL